jgi:hypothetical protein
MSAEGLQRTSDLCRVATAISVKLLKPLCFYYTILWLCLDRARFCFRSNLTLVAALRRLLLLRKPFTDMGDVVKDAAVDFRARRTNTAGSRTLHYDPTSG